MKPNGDKLLQSIKRIEQYATMALDNRQPFSDNLRKALVYIHCEARDMLEQEGEVKI